MTATLEALGDRRGQPTTAVVTTDGVSWSWPDLFAQFSPALLSFARSRGVSNPDDVVQDVFTTAVERFPGFEGDSSGLRSFLFTLAYRRVADEHRATYRRREQLVADHEPTPDNVNIEDSLTHEESAGEAMKALEILGERERQVIEMRIIEEASPAQVADRLGLSNGNVRVIQARALMKVRKYLASRSGALPSGALVLAFIKGLRSRLPADGELTEWIEMLHSESARGTMKTAAAGAGSAVAVGTASTGTIAGVIKIGLVVALATASTSAVEPVVANDRHAAGQLSGAGISVPTATQTERVDLAIPRVPADELPQTIEPDPAPVSPAVVVPTPVRSYSDDSQSVESPDDGTGQVADATEATAEESPQPVLGSVVEPVVEGLTNTVDEVVTGVVDTVDTVVEEVVEPVVETVDEVVDDTVGTVVNVVDDTTNTVDDVVDDLLDAVDLVEKNPLGGLLGG